MTPWFNIRERPPLSGDTGWFEGQNAYHAREWPMHEPLRGLALTSM